MPVSQNDFYFISFSRNLPLISILQIMLRCSCIYTNVALSVTGAGLRFWKDLTPTKIHNRNPEVLSNARIYIFICPYHI